MSNEVLLLKERVDRLSSSLSKGSFTDSEKVELSGTLDVLESLTVDKELLQTTRIGSSLTKLSKSLEPHCKESSRLVASVIEKWKNQLRSSNPSNPVKRQKTIDSTDSSIGLSIKSNPSISSSAPSVASSSLSATKDFSDLKLEPTHLPSNDSTNDQTGQQDDLKHGHFALSRATTGSASIELGRDGKEDDLDLPTYSGPVYNDALRDKALRYLFKCFLLGQDFGPELGKLNDLVYEIERGLYEHYIVNKNVQKEYNLQLKCLAFNLKDVKNTFFNYKVYSGVIPVSELVTMSSLQMASDEKKLERSEILEQSLEACQSDWAIKNIFLNQKNKGQFKCGKCNSRQTTYYQLQTRSSDEPMTTFVTCLNCKNRWRF